MAPPRFVAYYRVSTDKQGRSGLGLEAQQAAVAPSSPAAPPVADVSPRSRAASAMTGPSLPAPWRPAGSTAPGW